MRHTGNKAIYSWAAIAKISYFRVLSEASQGFKILKSYPIELIIKILKYIYEWLYYLSVSRTKFGRQISTPKESYSLTVEYYFYYVPKVRFTVHTWKLFGMATLSFGNLFTWEFSGIIVSCLLWRNPYIWASKLFVK